MTAVWSRSSLVALTTAGLLVCSGCASLPSSGDDPQGAEITRLERENLELRRELRMREVEMARLEQRLAGEPTARDVPASPAVPAEPIVDDTARPVPVGGSVEELDVTPPRIERVTPPPEDRPADIAAPTTPTSTEPIPDAWRALDDVALYDEAYALFHRQQYAQAERAFAHYLERAPESELADNAQFWIGETRWARGDDAGALDAFMQTVERFPRGNKVVHALLKAGQTLERMGRRDEAVETYREVLRLKPDSAAALTAQERLDALGAPAP
ncbi:MAG: tol-pal system protein YbgF [Acidobacteriota bacterium]